MHRYAIEMDRRKLAEYLTWCKTTLGSTGRWAFETKRYKCVFFFYDKEDYLAFLMIFPNVKVA